MTEIRTIRPEEAEGFLRVMCEVFDLNVARAQDVFFSEPLFDLDRKWAVFDGGRMVSILTTTGLEFGWGRAFGIAGVATVPDRQRQGLATQLLRRVLAHGEATGEPAGLLFARNKTVYARNGFRQLDRVVRSPILTGPLTEDPVIEGDEARRIYDAWAEADPNRLRRDDQRWAYWNWNFRVTTAFGEGYLCHEPGLLRECILRSPVAALPLPTDTEWFGTQGMARTLGLQLTDPVVELHLMGYQVPSVPLLFMTDQF